MEAPSNRFKLRMSKMFSSSFGSCKSKNNNDVVLDENPSQHYQLNELLSPKPSRPFSSICKETPQTEENCLINKSLLPRSKISEETDLLVSETKFEGRKCPPVSPVSPLNSNSTSQEPLTMIKQKRNKKPKSRKTRPRKKTNDFFFNFPGFEYKGIFSSDEEKEDEDDDKTTLFSSKSLTSDSSESFRRRNQGRRGAKNENQEKGGKLMPLQGRVRGSFAVVKRSSDPYNDFRTSMVEMIVEKQIFSAKDLENMLQCFLTLNSHHHHRIIVEVFMEIWEALFSNWS